MNLSDFPPDVQAAAIEAGNAFLRDERCGTSVRFGMASLGTRAALIDAFAGAIMADRTRRIDVTGLTTRQGECLRFIASHQEQHGGVTPSYREVADFLGLASVSGVVRLIDGLEDRGRIKRLPNRSRAITIIANPAN